jgi:hypothetical protein
VQAALHDLCDKIAQAALEVATQQPELVYS